MPPDEVLTASSLFEQLINGEITYEELEAFEQDLDYVEAIKLRIGLRLGAFLYKKIKEDLEEDSNA